MLDDANVLNREAIDMPKPPLELRRCYKRSTLKDVDLGFAGRYSPENQVHHSIASLVAGDQVQLRESGGYAELTDMHGNIVGRMSKAFTSPRGMQFLSGRILAIVVRKREDSEAQYQDRCRCDKWEVVVPELVFAPRV